MLAVSASCMLAEVTGAWEEAEDMETWDGSGDEEEQQPRQMTQEWWDLHYSEMLRGQNITGDPRVPGDVGDLFGQDLNDRAHFEAALALSEAALRQVATVAGGGRRPLEVLVVGCGLSPLVFALADHGPERLWTVRCLEISTELVEHLRGAAVRVPNPPLFEVGDITVTAEAAEGLGTATGASLAADVIIDENVLDGMGCTFPPEMGLEQQQRALAGMARRLRHPEGRLLTLSFLPMERPPFLENFRDWQKLHLGVANATSLENLADGLPMLTAELWAHRDQEVPAERVWASDSP